MPLSVLPVLSALRLFAAAKSPVLAAKEEIAPALVHVTIKMLAVLTLKAKAVAADKHFLYNEKAQKVCAFFLYEELKKSLL
jgi:hypothetical protein